METDESLRVSVGVPSEAVDVRVDKWSTPVLNDVNRLKLATFATNMRGSVTLANVEGEVVGSWQESLRLALHADRIGFDAVIPVARRTPPPGCASRPPRSIKGLTQHDCGVATAAVDGAEARVDPQPGRQHADPHHLVGRDRLRGELVR